MDENRRKLSWIGLAGALVLLVMIGYPILKEKVREYRQRDISLAMEQSAEMAGEIEKEETRKRYGSLEEEEAFGLREQGKVCPEIQLTVNRDGSGTIAFGNGYSFQPWGQHAFRGFVGMHGNMYGPSMRPARYDRPILENIRDVNQVYHILMEGR